MKVMFKIFCLFFIVLSCDDTKQGSSVSTNQKGSKIEQVLPASKRVDLVNKGYGPVKSIVLSDEIDQEMVKKGEDIFKKMCTACHKVDKKFIGPSPLGILKRRTPEWIMNMILNPDGMVQNDPLAKELLIEFNGSPMANQGLTESEAREVLEYFRTLKDFNAMM